MQHLVDSLYSCWYLWLSVLMFLLPYVLAPILPSTFKYKAVMELDCNVKKAYEAITKEPQKCTIGGSMTKRSQVGVAKKDGTPTEWKEDWGRTGVITVKRDPGVKPGKTARISQTMESERADMTSNWEYLLEPAGSGRCRITLDGYLEIQRGGKWNGPIFRLTVYLMEGGKAWMVEHLNLVADATQSKQKWIA
eukprot:CAMPEP_0113532158 /NCGR_PEP_ID=MMETSP0015_2-20120614/3898_1 /TAXON_ID=2838 /ORGANISM="Odontella" /LENGTH=192 /DNA_ID=CAMNT_0000431077 /DNA_START=125 /DNA_END=703 /DNA_ORIENTATION=+ /assembly_acc=CAM_ASM_000160